MEVRLLIQALPASSLSTLKMVLRLQQQSVHAQPALTALHNLREIVRMSMTEDGQVLGNTVTQFMTRNLMMMCAVGASQGAWG